jgi:acetolactate synthase I/II/III large subunit
MDTVSRSISALHSRGFARAQNANGRRVETADGLVPMLEVAFQEGGVQLVIVPVDYSENARVLVGQVTDNFRIISPKDFRVLT